MPENSLEKPVVKEDKKFTRKMLIIIFIGLIILLATGLAAILFLSRRTEPLEVTPVPQSQTSTSVTSSAVVDPMEMYIADYDVVTLEGGEINLTNVDRTKSLKLTDTGGKVVSFAISKDLTKIAYTTSDPALVEPWAKATEQAYSAFMAANYPDNPLSDTPLLRNGGVKLSVLDLPTNETKEITKLTDIPVPTSKENFQDLMVNWNAVWSKNFISPLVFNEEGTYLIYSVNGLNATNLGFQVSQKLPYEDSRACYTYLNAVWKANVLSISRGCYEWSEDHIFTFTDGDFVEMDFGDTRLGNYIGDARSVIGLNSQGVPYVHRQSYVEPEFTEIQTLDFATKQLVTNQKVIEDSFSIGRYRMIDDQVFAVGGGSVTYSDKTTISQQGKIFTLEGGKFTVLFDLPDMVTLDLQTTGFSKKGDKILIAGYKSFYKAKHGKDSNFFKYYYVDLVTKDVQEYMVVEVAQDSSGVYMDLFER